NGILMQHSSAVEILSMLFVLLLLSLMLEYYLLVLVDADSLAKSHLLLQKGANMVLALGKVLRITTILTYTGLTWIIIKFTSQIQQLSNTKQGWRSIFATALLTVISSYGLCTVSAYEVSVIYYLYPASSLGMLLSIPVL